MTTTEPLRYELDLPSPAADAFGVYVGRIGRWWDPAYTANPATLRSVTIEPRVGGRVYAVHTDLGEHRWGEVTRWRLGSELAYTFTLAQDPAHPTEVSVRFEDRGGGSSALRFEHGGWTADNLDARPRFQDWPRLLARFVAELR
jgi:hypothetical protein